jgi:hypothetical protein
VSARAKRHHIVNRAYLKRFADQSGKLLQHDKTKGNWTETSPDNAAVRSEFYTVETEDGRSDVLENALSSIEGGMMSAISAIDKGDWPLSDHDREAIAAFVGLQLVRGVDYRDSTTAFQREVAEKMLRMMGATGSGLARAFRETQGREPTSEELQELRRVAMTANVDVEVPRNVDAHLILEGASVQAEIAYAKSLHVLACSEDIFFTSDRPITLWQESPGPLGSVSFMLSDEACLPLDVNHCLMMRHPHEVNHRGEETLQDVSGGEARALNARMFGQAYRFVYCRPDLRDRIEMFLEG